MGGATFFTNKVPRAQFLCLIFSLVPSNFPLTRGTEKKKAEQFCKTGYPAKYQLLNYKLYKKAIWHLRGKYKGTRENIKYKNWALAVV